MTCYYFATDRERDRDRAGACLRGRRFVGGRRFTVAVLLREFDLDRDRDVTVRLFERDRERGRELDRLRKRSACCTLFS
jgi:hypothetical protein